MSLVSEIKYLGVIVDCNLNFKRPYVVICICKKISKKVIVLKRVSWYLSIQARKAI